MDDRVKNMEKRKIYEILEFRELFLKTRVGNISNETSKKVIQLALNVNSTYGEFEHKSSECLTEAIEKFGWEGQYIDKDKARKVSSIVDPMMSEYVEGEVEYITNIMKWEEFHESIMNNPSNQDLTVEDKTMLREFLVEETA